MINIDNILFIGFLVLNLLVGLAFGGKIKNIREYAVGDKNFSTPTLTATIIATCIGGGFFSGAITESYRQGLYFIIPAIGEPLSLIITGYFLAPRMGEFLGTISVAEAMGNLYGKTVQRISALSSIFLCIGIIALQFKVSSTIMQVFFGVSSFYAVLLSAVVVVLYSAFGGIRAVTFTDVIQFFTFGTIIPIISFIIWGTFKDPYQAFAALSTKPELNFSEVLNINNAKFLNSFLLLLFFLIPDLQPVFYQRIVMAKSVFQARRSFIIAGIIILFILLITIWVGILLLSDNPSLDPNNLLAYIIEKYSYPGLRGITAIGIMAIIMSTADSYINSAAVLVSNDLINIDKKTKDGTSLLLPRAFSLAIGVASFFLAFKSTSILNLLVLILSFYGPVVSAPLLLAIFGFRSTSKSVLVGMFFGISTVLLFKIIDFGIEGVIPGILANAVSMIFIHYITKQKGGFVGIKDDKAMTILRRGRDRKVKNFLYKIKTFNFVEFCIKQKPKADGYFTLFGIFGMVSIFSTMYSLSTSVRELFSLELNYIYDSVLFSSSIFVTYPIWPDRFKNQKIISLAWLFFAPYILVCVASYFVLISNFAQLQLMIFMVNLIILGMFFRWDVALISTTLGIFISYSYYRNSIDASFLEYSSIDLRFKIIYILLMFSSVLIAFVKPNQEQFTRTEEKIEHLLNRVEDREEELNKALSVKKEFLKNINHEFRTSIMGVMTIVSELETQWDTLSDDQRKYYMKSVADSSNRLASYIRNISDFTKLSKEAKIEKNLVNLSDLLEERIEKCKKLYGQQNDEVEIISDIEKDIEVLCDRYYITQALDNLIINAINYGNGLPINIKLTKRLDDKNNTYVNFSIEDHGIGIPKDELSIIFEPFVVSSKTKSSAGGRGMGLPVVKKIIDLHDGKIIVKSDIKKGSIFGFIL